MVSIPAANYLSDGGRTEGEIKVALENQRTFITQLPGGVTLSTLTIASGVVTPTAAEHRIDTEGAASADDLTGAAMTNLPDGSYLKLASVASARVPTVKHAAGGTGEFILADARDLALRDPKQWVRFKRVGTQWVEEDRSPSALFAIAEESGFVVVSAKGQADRVERVRYLPTGHGRLNFISATQIRLDPYDGNLLPVKDANGWRLRTIPSAGIASGNPTTASNFVNGTGSQTLTASTTYEVYVFDNSGTLTLDFRTPGHAVDVDTGVEIKTAVDTRTLVGMVRTNSTPNFVDSLTQRFVASWFNRRPRAFVKEMHSADVSSGSTTYVELNGSGSRVEFLTWLDGRGEVQVAGVVLNNTSGNFTWIAVHFDGSASTLAGDGSYLLAWANNAELSLQAGLSMDQAALAEGYHFASPFGKVTTATTGTWRGGTGDISVHTKGWVEI